MTLVMKPEIERGMYRHVKTGGLYWVERVIPNWSNRRIEPYSVLYLQMDTGEWGARDYSEFIQWTDGVPRFERMDTEDLREGYVQYMERMRQDDMSLPD